MSRIQKLLNDSWGYQSGHWKHLAEISWSLSDLGTLQGAIIVERLRTFGGVPFLVEEHLRRFQDGGEQLGIFHPSNNEFFDVPSIASLQGLLDEFLKRNHGLISEMEDIGIVMLLSPGDPGWDSQRSAPTFILHAVPIPWKKLHHWYQSGCDLSISSVQNVPNQCWSPSIKTRSRLQYYLADWQAHRERPGSIAVLLNAQNHITETSVANLVVVNSANQLLSPSKSTILPGVSLEVLDRIACNAKCPIQYRDVTLEEFQQAKEILMVGTTGCLWNAATLNGVPIGEGPPYPKSHFFQQQWKEILGFDFIEQSGRWTS